MNNLFYFILKTNKLFYFAVGIKILGVDHDHDRSGWSGWSGRMRENAKTDLSDESGQVRLGLSSCLKSPSKPERLIFSSGWWQLLSMGWCRICIADADVGNIDIGSHLSLVEAREPAEIGLDEGSIKLDVPLQLN